MSAVKNVLIQQEEQHTRFMVSKGLVREQHIAPYNGRPAGCLLPRRPAFHMQSS